MPPTGKGALRVLSGQLLKPGIVCGVRQSVRVERLAFRFAGVAMRVIVVAVVAISALYVADLQFTDGRYSAAAVQLIAQIKRSMGF